MAKLTRAALEEIIKDQMPGYRIVRYGPVQDAVARRVVADQQTPDLDTLKRVGREPSRGGGMGEASDDSVGMDDAEQGEDQMVVLAPQKPTSPLDHGAKAKVVVVSATDGKIVTSQG
jgi:hypothetical protein